ncbi:Uncharacterised protein [Grimontia hollisae]|uniref:Uncharacterized protein n=1 Tax=Grimontia hollisae TaxID=673 RepID=A0A377HPS8_GRIHO|nr:Uncharacterised protein [Grimontia hollisae]
MPEFPHTTPAWVNRIMSNGPVTRLAGSAETAVRDLLYVFAVSNDLMAEMTKRSRRLCCSRALAANAAKRMLLPIDRRRAHMC